MSEKETMEEVARRTSGNLDPGAPDVVDAVQHLRDLYDSEVYYWDRCLGELVAGLRERGLLDQTVLVITADHGEEFLEHGMFQHGQQLYQETVQVPLLIRVPGVPAAAVTRPVQSLDLKPTVLSLLGLQGLSESAWGETLPPRGPERALFLSTETGVEQGVPGTLAKHAVVVDEAKLVWVPVLGKTELYDLAQDPAESRDLAATEPERTALLRRRIEAWLEEARPELPAYENLDPESLEIMKELGYLDR
jgi:arylsulfatase A-like enzyme